MPITEAKTESIKVITFILLNFLFFTMFCETFI